MMDSSCIVKCFISFYNVTFNTKMLYICFLYVVYIILFIISFLIILAHFYILSYFFFQITENYLLFCFISAIYMFKITIIELFLTNIHFGFYFQCYYG